MLVAFLCKSSRAGWLLIDTLNSVLFCTLPQATDKQCSQRCNAPKLTVSSGVEQILRQNFVTSCPWLLKPLDGQTDSCIRSQKLAHIEAKISLHHALFCWDGEVVMLVSSLCISSSAGGVLMESFNTVLLCTPMLTCHMQYSQYCNASMLSLSSDVKQTHSQNFVTSCPWPLKPMYGQTSFCVRSKDLRTYERQNFVTSCLALLMWRSWSCCVWRSPGCLLSPVRHLLSFYFQS